MTARLYRHRVVDILCSAITHKYIFHFFDYFKVIGHNRYLGPPNLTLADARGVVFPHCALLL